MAKIDADIKEKFIRLRAKGQPFKEIAKKLQISIGSCSNLESQLQYEIETERERLNKAFQNASNDYVSTIGKALSRIEEELSTRNLEEIPTEALAELLLLYATAKYNAEPFLPIQEEKKVSTSIFDDLDSIEYDKDLLF